MQSMRFCVAAFSSSVFLLFVLVLCPTLAGAADITIDHTVKYQTMVGLGGRVGASAQQTSDFVNDVGFSVFRTDWCGGGGGIREVIDAGCKTIVGACWSPPANMKTNGRTEGGGSLKTDSYDAFADLALSTLKSFKSTYGVEMYALSAQNEPDFVEFYNSCVYTEGSQLLDVTKRIDAKIKAAGLNTKTSYHEDMYAAFFGKYFRAYVDDAGARNVIDAFSFHGYNSDGVTAAKMQAATLGRMYDAATKYGCELWNTESAGSFGMNYVNDVIACMRYGKVSMFLKFGLAGDAPGLVGDVNEYLITGGKKTTTYYACKTLAKFIRPGAVQLKSSCADSASIGSCFVAFYDKAAGALVISLATGATAPNISIKGAGLPAKFQKWVTNPSTNCVNQGDVSPTDISLPANSAITLYGTGYTLPATGVAPIPRQSSRSSLLAQAGRRYTVQGRCLRFSGIGAGPERMAGAVVVQNGAGRRARLLCQ